MFSRQGVNRDQRGSELSIGNQDVPVVYPDICHQLFDIQLSVVVLQIDQP